MEIINKETLVITDPLYVKGSAQPLIDEDTIYGDWSCMAYKTSREEAIRLSNEWDAYYNKFFHDYNFTDLSDKEKKKLYADFKKHKKEWIEKYCYGEFCADCGRVAVYTLTEIEKNSPEFVEWAKKHPWCVTFVPDYSGSVDYVVGDEEDANIFGENLSTVQRGL